MITKLLSIFMKKVLIVFHPVLVHLLHTASYCEEVFNQVFCIQCMHLLDCVAMLNIHFDTVYSSLKLKSVVRNHETKSATQAYFFR